MCCVEGCFASSYEELLESSDEDDEVPHPNRKQVSHPNRKSVVAGKAKAWIKEGTEDDPVNFMDPMAVKSILGM